MHFRIIETRVEKGMLNELWLFLTRLRFEILDGQHPRRIDDCYEGAVHVQRHLLRLRPHRVPDTRDHRGGRGEVSSTGHSVSCGTEARFSHKNEKSRQSFRTEARLRKNKQRVHLKFFYIRSATSQSRPKQREHLFYSVSCPVLEFVFVLCRTWRVLESKLLASHPRVRMDFTVELLHKYQVMN